MTELLHLTITFIVVVGAIWAKHVAPHAFFALMALAARRTPIGYLMRWYRCQTVYVTNNDSEDIRIGKPITDKETADNWFDQVGLTPPSDLSRLRTVEEELIIVSFWHHCVAWSNLAPSRIRLFGFLYDGTVLYGAWYDWDSRSRYRGTMFIGLSRRQKEGGMGIWTGPPLALEARLVRANPWIWLSMQEIRPFGTFENQSKLIGSNGPRQVSALRDKGAIASASSDGGAQPRGALDTSPESRQDTPQLSPTQFSERCTPARSQEAPRRNAPGSTGSTNPVDAQATEKCSASSGRSDAGAPAPTFLESHQAPFVENRSAGRTPTRRWSSGAPGQQTQPHTNAVNEQDRHI